MQVGTPCITKVEDKSDYSGSTSVETRSPFVFSKRVVHWNYPPMILIGTMGDGF